MDVVHDMFLFCNVSFPGFALLEAGSVRAMNTKNIIMQNILDTGKRMEEI